MAGVGNDLQRQQHKPEYQRSRQLPSGVEALKLSLPAGEKRKLLVNGVEGTGVEALSDMPGGGLRLARPGFYDVPGLRYANPGYNGWPQNPRWRYRLPGLQHCAVW